MTPRTRSVSGAVMAILAVPFLIGLLACIPVPIGDPERGTIDPDISGIWLAMDEDEDELIVTLFEPFDKRAWLVTRFALEVDDDCYEGVDESEGHVEIMAALRSMGADCLTSDEQQTYKAWRKKLGDHWYMTWEYKGVFDDEYGYAPGSWLGYRIYKDGPYKFTLRMINGEDDVFSELKELKAWKELEETGPPYDPRGLRTIRRAMERIIRQNADNDDIYMDSDVKPMIHYRIQPDDYELFIGNVVPSPDD